MLIGVGVGAVLTLVVLAPFWVAPGSHFWNRMGNGSKPMLHVVAAVMYPFAIAGWEIAGAIHHHRCEPLGCRNIHTGWVLGWSMVVNSLLGGLLGLATVAVKNSLRRTTGGTVRR